MNEIQKYIIAHEPEMMNDLFSLIPVSVLCRSITMICWLVQNAGRSCYLKLEQMKHW